MTTAHRPTWKAAVGQASTGGWTAGGAVSTAVSSLDMAAHTKLKVRTGPQMVDRKKALRESLFKLEQAEQQTTTTIQRLRRRIEPSVEEEGKIKLLKQTAEVDEVALRQKYDDDDADGGGGGGGADGEEDDWDDVRNDNDSDLDASSSEEEEDDDDDDDDDEAALQAELAKIRAEREAQKAKHEAEEAAVEEAKLEEAALLGNPLLATAGATTGKLKRRWNDDVVFRNQAKGEPEIKKRFINDTVRNDFHKRFLNKFIR